MYYELTRNCIKAEKGLLYKILSIFSIRLLRRVAHPHDAPPRWLNEKNINFNFNDYLFYDVWFWETSTEVSPRWNFTLSPISMAL